MDNDPKHEMRSYHLVMPDELNHHGNLFGGVAISWMDQVAYMVAARWCRREAVTVNINTIDFEHPVRAGMMVSIIARIVGTGRTSMRIDVEMWGERLTQPGDPFKVGRGEFIMVALGDDGKPTPVPPLKEAD